MPLADEPRDTSFAFFSVGLALTLLFNYSSNSIGATPLTVTAGLLAVLVLGMPRSPWALGALCLAYIVQYQTDERVPLVHTHFDFVITCTVLSCLALSFRAEARAWATRFVHVFAPIGLCIAGISFFAAGFSKLNTDFANPDISCATVFYEWSRTVFPYTLLPTGDLAISGVVGLTWVTEMLGPLLLIHPRTRRVGFFLILLMAFLLGTNVRARYYEFTSPFIALCTLCFVYEGLEQRLVATSWGSWLSERRRWVSAGTLLVIGGAVVLAMVTENEGRSNELRLLMTRTAFVTWVLALVLPAALLSPVARPLQRPRLPAFTHIAWLAVLFVGTQEATSYVGMRAAGAFAMAGNFRLTPQVSNHLVVRRAPELPFNEPAILLRSSLRELDGKGRYLLPDWVVYDTIARNPDHWAIVKIDGVQRRIVGGSEDPRLHRNPMATLFPTLRMNTGEFPSVCGHPLPEDSMYVQRRKDRRLRLKEAREAARAERAARTEEAEEAEEAEP